MGEDPLGLDPETMRRLGYQTVDLLVDRLAGLGDEPVLRRGTPGELARRLSGPPPAGPQRFEGLLEQLFTDVLPFISRNDHPALPGLRSRLRDLAGVLGDLIASACNIEASSWVQAAGPSQVELVVLDWFEEWIGYPHEAAGVLVSGGSAANLTALACAREALLGAMSDQVVGYLSDQAHSSMARAARVLGFRPDQVRVLPVDAAIGCVRRRWPPRWTRTCAAGRRPLFVAASAGPPTPGRSTRCRSWRRSAASGGCGSTSTRPTAASRR